MSDAIPPIDFLWPECVTTLRGFGWTSPTPTG